MIGIITAINDEILALKDSLSDYKVVEKDGCIFYEGENYVAIKAGVGKVACAYHCTKLIDLYHPELLLNVGVAGSLKEEIKTGSLVIADKVTYHDFIIPEGLVDDEIYTYEVKEKELAIAKKLKEADIYFGSIISGDLFVQKEDALKILKRFPEGLACEMEAGALAQVATLANLPFLVIRAISDVAVSEGNDVQFDEFCAKAAKRSAKFCKDYLELYYGK